MPPITLACGVAVAQVLNRCGISVQLKWPNDIRIDGRKLGGILTELVADRYGGQTLIVGVGINRRVSEDAQSRIGQPAIALDELDNAPQRPREQWIGEFGGAIFSASALFAKSGFGPFRAPFNQLLESRGETVDVLNDAPGTPAISGRIIEVDHDGRLIIEAEGMRHALSVGEVSVRR